MKITWYGHAAFLVEARTRDGRDVRIILDPYNYPDCGGYLPIDEPADIVSISHDNVRYHSDTSAIRGEFELFEGLAHLGSSRSIHGVELRACEVWEDAEQQGPNAMVRFELEGLTVLHQGDLGHALEGDALEFSRGVDVLLALTGGAPTIALDDLMQSIEATKPVLVLPMHYGTPKVNLDLLPLEAFLDVADELPIERPGSSTVELSRERLPASTTVLVLEHAR